MPRKGPAARPEIVDLALELFQPLGTVSARRMFGGWGFFYGERMFALVAYDTLYLKADDVNRPSLEAAGMPRFTYDGKGRTIALPYWQAPPEAMEDPAEMRPWAEASIAAARRKAKP